MITNNVFWLSRHKITINQAADLSSKLETAFKVITINPVFPAKSDELEIYINAIIGNEPRGTIIAGVFPAHIAIKLMSICKARDWRLMLPVSVAAAAVEGETRGNGFTHSHWEEV